MSIPGNLLTTAMAVMPHKNVDRALEVALSMDVPFWPQLPLHIYCEDMYVQASEHFPGILLDLENRTLRFSTDKFTAELEETLAHFEEPEYFDVSETYSVVYRRFLGLTCPIGQASVDNLKGQSVSGSMYWIRMIDPFSLMTRSGPLCWSSWPNG